jgi:hypothetical protein
MLVVTSLGPFKKKDGYKYEREWLDIDILIIFYGLWILFSLSFTCPSLY